MAKVSLLEDSEYELSYSYYCPGCRCGHYWRTRRSHPDQALWTWNEDYEKPTVIPSIDCNREHPEARCHSIITNGMIRFLGDCYHHLKGQTVPMEEDD